MKRQEEGNKESTQDQALDNEFCEHVFMPIDSTGETLSCIKCGTVIHNKP